MAKPELKTDTAAEPSIASVASGCLDAADGDVMRATAIMVGKVTKDSVLYRVLMDPLVREACYAALTQACRRRRRTVWDVQPPSAETQRNTVVDLARGMTLLDFPLPGGLRLRDASRDDVAAAAEFYLNQASDMAVKGRWLRLVAQAVPGKKKVGSVLSIERLEELKIEATK
jgi:hypothetical protein